METEILYELSNPSDTVTFTAPHFDAAFCAVLLVGRGMYGANAHYRNDERLSDAEADLLRTPTFPFGGLDVWEEQNCVKVNDLIEQFREDIIETLRGFVYCTIREHRLMRMALAAITEDDKRRSFLEQWNEANRSSMNNICGAAHAIADNMARGTTEETTDAS